MSAFKFIGYYDEENGQIYAKKDHIAEDNLFSVYFSKKTSDYLFLNSKTLRVPSDEEKVRINLYTMQRTKRMKKNIMRVGAFVVTLSLIAVLKYDADMEKWAKETDETEKNPQVSHQMLKTSYIIDEGNIKDRLVDFINAMEISVDDKNYRMLYYLYYVTFLDKGVGDNFINDLVDKESTNKYVPYRDLVIFYLSSSFNYTSVLKTPELDASKITYENMDIFLELNMLLNREVVDGNISLEEYENYIGILGRTLKEKDVDLYRVWSYHVNNTSMMGKLVNLKIVAFSKTLELTD